MSSPHASGRRAADVAAAARLVGETAAALVRERGGTDEDVEAASTLATLGIVLPELVDERAFDQAFLDAQEARRIVADSAERAFEQAVLDVEEVRRIVREAVERNEDKGTVGARLVAKTAAALILEREGTDDDIAAATALGALSVLLPCLRDERAFEQAFLDAQDARRRVRDSAKRNEDVAAAACELAATRKRTTPRADAQPESWGATLGVAAQAFISHAAPDVGRGRAERRRFAT